MNLETGTPKIDGRYIAYVEGVMGWLEPKMILRCGPKWRFLNSTEEYTDHIFGWIGPLPVMSKEAWNRATAPEPRGMETQFPDEPYSYQGAVSVEYDL